MTNKHEKMAYVLVIKEMQTEMRYHFPAMRMTKTRMRSSLKRFGRKDFLYTTGKKPKHCNILWQFFYCGQYLHNHLKTHVQGCSLQPYMLST